MRPPEPVHRAPQDDPAEAGLRLVDPDREPELAALLSRTTSLLTQPPDELTTQRLRRRMRQEVRHAAGTPGGGPLRFVGTAAGVAAVLVVTLAGLGTLPEPVQLVMADVAERVGIELPRPVVEVGDGATDPPATQPAEPGSGPDAPDDPPGNGTARPEGFPKPDGLPGATGRGPETRPDAAGRDAQRVPGPAHTDPQPPAEPGPPRDLPPANVPAPSGDNGDAPPEIGAPRREVAPTEPSASAPAQPSGGAPTADPDRSPLTEDPDHGAHPPTADLPSGPVPPQQPDADEPDGAAATNRDQPPAREPSIGTSEPPVS